MIQTLDSKKELNKGCIQIIDDINSTNKVGLESRFSNSDLVITQKITFPTPDETAKIISNGFKIIDSEFKEKVDSWIKYNNYNETKAKNFKIKIEYWLETVFNRKLDKITVSYNLKDQELFVLSLLTLNGTDVLVVDNKIDEIENTVNILKNIFNDEINQGKIEIAFKKYGTHEELKINNKETEINNKENNVDTIEKTEIIKCETLNDIESTIYDSKGVVKIIVSGIDSYIDTCNFYAKLHKTCDNSKEFILFNNNISAPTYEDTAAIPKLKIDRHDYIVQTLIQFVKCNELNTRNSVINAIKDVFNSPDNIGLTGSILYNKMIYVICTINKILSSNNSIKCIVYYGKPNKLNSILLEVLGKIPNISVIVVCSDKSKQINIGGFDKLELEGTMEEFPMPLIDKREQASTMAAQAEQRINETLYNGDTLGMYKPGMFKSCNVIDFNTTYDEIKLWWNEDTYIRPGFQVSEDIATIPVIFRIIKGVRGTEQEYISDIQKLCCGKTLLCSHGVEYLNILAKEGYNIKVLRDVDINGTLFSEQQKIFENGKINKQVVLNDKNYQYGLLDINKQYMILDKIQDILNGDYINKQKYFKDEQSFIDTVLNVTLNLDTEILRLIQWFEFYTYNPNLIITLNNEDMPTIQNFILLVLLKLLGFDILIFVPTCYTTIENMCGAKFDCITDLIGEASYNVNTSSLHVTSNIKIIRDNVQDQVQQTKKQGFFSKLFGK